MSYTVSTVGYAIALAVVFAVWYRVERTLSIHSVRTPRREAFYWAFWFAYIVTRPLGASIADWMAYRHGGLGWGQGPVALAWTVAIGCFVIFLGFSRKGVVELAD